MHDFMRNNSQGFGFGETNITSRNDKAIGMHFSILKLRKGEHLQETLSLEKVYLLMTGRVHFAAGQIAHQAERSCIFSQAPTALHCAKGEAVKLSALTHTELVVIDTPNDNLFPSRLFESTSMLENDKRGQGLLNDTSYRLVRTLFDKRNRPESNLVLGEIITYPGHWSSTPSHTHPHPEVYHYRFSEPQGFAFAECGEAVVRVRHNDTMLITDSKAHAHAAAPGYCLYTLWFIRHLENNPYIVPDFQQNHCWAKEKSANLRVWQDYREIAND